MGFLGYSLMESGIVSPYRTVLVDRGDSEWWPGLWSQSYGCGNICVLGRVVIPTLKRVVVRFLKGDVGLLSD